MHDVPDDVTQGDEIRIHPASSLNTTDWIHGTVQEVYRDREGVTRLDVHLEEGIGDVYLKMRDMGEGKLLYSYDDDGPIEAIRRFEVVDG